MYAPIYINDSCERLRAITYASLAVGRLEEEEDNNNEENEQSEFYNFPRITLAVYFTYFDSIIVYRSTLESRLFV